MNTHRRAAQWVTLVFVLLLIAACGSGDTRSEDDRIATRVAEELAVAATLTARASSPEEPAEDPVEEPADPTDTPIAVAQVTDTPIPPTDTPVVVDSVPIAAGVDEPSTDDPAATSAAVVTTFDPTDTPVPTATPESTPVVLGYSPVDGDDGNDFVRSSIDVNQGRVVLLPGFAEQEISEPMVFRDRIALRVEVFDERYSQKDGDGIVSVTYTIENPEGNDVYQKREESAAYCLFGGNEPICNGLAFEQAGFQWPGGAEITNGEHVARIDIVPEQGEVTQWRWRFNIDIPGREALGEPVNIEPDNAAPNTALIIDIGESHGRYIVEFETFDFVPTLPGQHVHFFWNTVPPEQAGVPGSGPWQLYPASQGGPGDSPFTLFTAADRPHDATQICVLVANADHSVKEETGNCVDLP